jgi:hypothetical protein
MNTQRIKDDLNDGEVLAATLFIDPGLAATAANRDDKRIRG